ncbi:PREDICTED: translation initiation factor IF-2, mitochondrial isoform X1 [Polistes dominula]|uniref:Translation initiation factor IF-2, mitochondrial isoform X1 n=2 Tax=Polistes dominula TaxID=743375 RepID=A0ABM1ID43_POLDO|nr:PREDICTED: translation initiation factor IF-2, mitochondrial isoform X1 [Polistes dominula]
MMNTSKMFPTLIKTCSKFSGLKQCNNEVIKQRRYFKHNIRNSAIIFIKYDYFHTTSHFNERTKELKSLKETKTKRPLVNLWSGMKVDELAIILKRDIKDILSAASLSDKNKRYSFDSDINDPQILSSIVRKLGFRYKIVPKPTDVQQKQEDYDAVVRPPPDESVLVNRRPVVTIMGHVDHGKTTLLDALRDTSVVDTEFGGITQHIGAFNVELITGEKITFLDTPGHAAFTSMRERGAQVTDIVVLVVAADDGVMEQTIQSIDMAKAANVPIIVAINKIDKHNADILRTQKMLQQQGIIVEQLGGEVQCVNISALKGTNLNTLVEAIALQAEIIGLKGDPTGLVEGVVIECRNDKARGKLSTALIQRGTLKKNSVLVSGTAWAKVRSMFDHAGKPVIQASLSDAIQIMGWRELPDVGDKILEVKNEQEAHTVIRYRQKQIDNIKAEEHKKGAELKLHEHLIEYTERLAKRRAMGRKYYKREPRKKEDTTDPTPKLNIILKTDVSGSAEAILDVIGTYTADELCRLNVVHYGVGSVTENDLELASTFDAIIYLFNISISNAMQKNAIANNIIIRPCNVIYKLIDDIKNEINLKLPLKDSEEIIGEADFLKQFDVKIEKKKVSIAGCQCTKGILKKNELYHLKRGDNIVYTGKLLSMRHHKEEVDTIKSGTECGLRFVNSSITFQPGDKIICFKPYQEKQTIEWDAGF